MPYTYDTEGLTAKRRAFVDEYLIDFNATQAAKRAGYGAKSAGTIGSRLLHMPAVKAALDRAIAARAARTRVSADNVIAELRRIGFSDMRHFATWNESGVTLRPHTSLSDDDAAAVVELRPVGDKGNVRIRLHEKRPALDALARHLGVLGARRPGRTGDPGRVPVPFAGDYSNEQQRGARATLKALIDKIVADRPKAVAGNAAIAPDGGADGGPDDGDTKTKK
jgi:phage terminase small subunit